MDAVHGGPAAAGIEEVNLFVQEGGSRRVVVQIRYDVFGECAVRLEHVIRRRRRPRRAPPRPASDIGDRDGSLPTGPVRPPLPERPIGIVGHLGDGRQARGGGAVNVRIEVERIDQMPIGDVPNPLVVDMRRALDRHRTTEIGWPVATEVCAASSTAVT